ncbi:trafficking particle complex subunit 6B, partial [Brachionus plicatilis]
MVPDTYRFTDEIGIMKYVCKEFWTSMFSKQIDNLRTNNSGIFVLQDNNFKILSQISDDPNSATTLYYVSFICGMLKGVVSNLGYPNTVTFDTKSTPC